MGKLLVLFLNNPAVGSDVLLPYDYVSFTWYILFHLFVAYLTTLSEAETVYLQIIGLVNNDLKMLWKEVIIVLLKVLSQNLPGGGKENHKKPQSE
jgi:hypothetical protein